MFKAILALLMTSVLHGNTMAPAEFNEKTAWERQPILSVQPLPQKSDDESQLEITAGSAIVIDLTSSKILYTKNETERRPIASLTKLMTGLIIASEETPYTVIKVSQNAAGTEGSTIFLNAEEEITVKDLVYGMMIASGNDAALALAEYNGGSMEKFVRKMNDRAKNLGLNNTHYTNPMGFDHENNYSTAEDLSLLSLYVLQNDFLTTPANLEKYEIESRSGISHEYVTTNQLLNKELNIPGVVVHGLKTGRTPDAGECLISVATDDKGHEIMTVVLGSQERFQDTQKLIEWVYTNYRW
jgi:serine-type D-Ala-D-Ala carboxypeptidase (penicillin-binding protein 5/6)